MARKNPHDEKWQMAKVYLPPEAHRWIRLIAASENISRSSVMMRIITNYFAGIQNQSTSILKAFKALPDEMPHLKNPRRRPGPPTSTVKIGHPAQQAPQKISLTRLATEDEREE